MRSGKKIAAPEGAAKEYREDKTLLLDEHKIHATVNVRVHINKDSVSGVL